MHALRIQRETGGTESASTKASRDEPSKRPARCRVMHGDVVRFPSANKHAAECCWRWEGQKSLGRVSVQQ